LRKLGQQGITALVALLVLQLFSASPASGESEGGQVFVYLEVPREYSDETVLSLASAELQGAAGPQQLDLRLFQVSATELSGTQVLLASGRVRSDQYDSLSLNVASIATHAGVAPVTTGSDNRGFSIPTDAILDPMGVAVIRLVWKPGITSMADKPIDLNMKALHEPIPSLGSLTFSTDSHSGCLFFVDRNMGRVVGATMIGQDPRGMVYDRIQQKLYVALAGDDGIAVLDGLTHRIERTVPLQFGDDPDRLALSPDGATLYVMNQGSRSLVGIATWSMQENHRASVGDRPRSIAVDPLTGYIYVACEGENEVQVFNPVGIQPMAALSHVPNPVEVLFGERTRQLFIGSSSLRQITGIDLETGLTLAGQNLCGVGRHLAYNPKLRQLFIAQPECREVAVIQPEGGHEFAPLAFTSRPGRMTFSKDHRSLLVLLPQEGALAICSPQRGRIEHVIHVGDMPHSIIAP